MKSMKRYAHYAWAIVCFCYGIDAFTQSTPNPSSMSPENGTIQLLHTDWEFKEKDTQSWFPAEVPGTVHTDLMKNEKIEDPYYRTNEADLQWIDKKKWEYRTVFDVDADLFQKDEIHLIFEGLDTYADVYVNDRNVLEADNMFLRWEVPVKHLLREDKNELRIVFHSPITIGLEKHDALGYPVPVSANDQAEHGQVPDNKMVSVFTRKAGYHFGWDWGPRLVTSGVWRPVYLQGWGDGRITDVYVRQKAVKAGQADLLTEVTFEAGEAGQMEAQVWVNETRAAYMTVEAKAGQNQIIMPVQILRPRLWWPNGMGEPYLYSVEVRLLNHGILVATKEVKTGLRTVELVREADSAGVNFFFKVNGIPVFSKGANYIPQDNFLPRVTRERYEHVIRSAVETNMNMLRVWGGGIYENEVFYELCDQNGILVWQDFMFACALFPGNPEFLENVRKEAEYNVRRLRNHPSIALWCGNNESLAAWHRWGWRDNMEKENPEQVRLNDNSYNSIFHEILPEAVKQYDAEIPYWASSPQADQGVAELYNIGDVHYWGVWWGKEPFTNYRKKIGRFMSEYGFQSFPEMNTVRRFALPEDYAIESPVMNAHQRSSIGNTTIAYYMDQQYRKPKNFTSFVYTGLLLQAEGIKVAMEGHRKAMPYCMGSLFWQIDDCWPVASWSSMDYYGNWKAQMYFAKHAFAPVLVSPELNGEQVDVFVISDQLEAKKATLEVTVQDFNGKEIGNQQLPVRLPANGSRKAHSQKVNSLLEGGKPDQSLVLFRLKDESGEELSRNILYFKEPKDLKLPKPKVRYTIEEIDGETHVRLSTNALAKNVFLQLENGGGRFSDNFFDLLPGEERVVRFIPGTDAKVDLKKDLSIVTLRDTY